MKPRSWLARHWLFILIGLTYAYFFQGSDPNQTTRYLLTKSLVERQAPDITPEASRTIDKGFFDGKYYSDKAPGVAALATVPYALMNVADRVFHIEATSRTMQRVRLHMLAITTSGVAGAIACYYVSRILMVLGSTVGEAELLAVGYGLGTLVFPFSTVMFGHQTAAAILAGVFHRILKLRVTGEPARAGQLVVLGLFMATSIVVEYPTGMLVAPIGLYLLSTAPDARSRIRMLAFTSLGGAAPLILHGLFLNWSYGSPFALPYKFVSEPVFVAHVSKGILGIGLPTKVGIFGVLFSRYRGLFYYCPFLVLTPLGFAAWIRQGKRLREALLCAILIAIYLLFCTSYYAWDGGGSTGPRHLVPVLAFFVIPIGYFLRSWRYAFGATLAAIVPSILVMTACVACLVHLPEGDVETFDPLYEFVFPSIFRGELAQNLNDLSSAPVRRADASYNLGLLFHLSPAMSLVVPLAAWLLALAPRAVRRWRRPVAEAT